MCHRHLQWLQRASVMGSTPEDGTSVAQWPSNELLIRRSGFESRQKLPLNGINVVPAERNARGEQGSS
jgi:hypothetical protein